jgi:hypothetical protein
LLFAVGVLDKSMRILMRVIGKTSLRTKLQSTISVQLGEHIIEIFTGVSKKNWSFWVRCHQRIAFGIPRTMKIA